MAIKADKDEVIVIPEVVAKPQAEYDMISWDLDIRYQRDGSRRAWARLTIWMYREIPFFNPVTLQTEFHQEFAPEDTKTTKEYDDVFALMIDVPELYQAFMGLEDGVKAMRAYEKKLKSDQ